MRFLAHPRVDWDILVEACSRMNGYHIYRFFTRYLEDLAAHERYICNTSTRDRRIEAVDAGSLATDRFINLGHLRWFLGLHAYCLLAHKRANWSLMNDQDKTRVLLLRPGSANEPVTRARRCRIGAALTWDDDRCEVMIISGGEAPTW